MVNPVNVKLALLHWFKHYKNWIASNPNVIADIESTLKHLYYFIPDRYYDLALTSEFVYSLPNLIIFFNDQIIKASKFPESHLPKLYSKLKIWLTVINYTEVLFEVSARRFWGEAGRWLIISLIQLLKVVMRLTLIYRYKERITQTPAIPPLNREKLIENCNEYEAPKEAFSLKRSGKIVKTVRGSSTESRVWVPLVPSTSIENGNIPTESLNDSLLLAETMYVLKPLLHLGYLSISGKRNWNPWLLSLFIDVVSLKIFSKEPELSKKEQEELIRRWTNLLLYILRSPFYDKYSRVKIFAMLGIITKKIPLARFITNPISKYIPNWQSTYFYTWSN